MNGWVMSKIIVNGKKYQYARNATLEAVAADFQNDYQGKIVLATKNGVLRELFRTVGDGGDISFLTVNDTAGYATYQRSAVFLLYKALTDVDESLARTFYADFSVSNGIYCMLRGHKTTEAFLKKVRARMKELVAENIPFTKEAISTRFVIDVFATAGLKDKANLFRYRRASETKVYRLDGTPDYFFAYLVPSTGYLTDFRLLKYGEGMLLQIPEKAGRIRAFQEKPKLFQTMVESSKWGESIGIQTVGDLNDRIVSQKADELIYLQEAIMEKRIGDVAAQIKESGKRIVMIAGPSSSGKTTFSYRLSTQLLALGLHPHPIACDDYFKNRSEYPKDENGEVDFESIDCVDSELLTEHLNSLLQGKRIELPTYDFTVGERVYKGKTLQIGSDDVVILEGIHCLNEALTSGIRKEDKFKIYISALTQLNVDEHNYISTTDGRLLRRIVRDARTRGYSAQDTIGRWNSVIRGEEKNIFPYQEDCDAMVNSALIYELSVLKPYAEPLLFQVPQDSPEYLEAKRLLKFLDYFLTIPSENVPKTSLVREFIGGSAFET